MKKRVFNDIGSVFILMCAAVFGTMMTSWSFMQTYATEPLVWWAAMLCSMCGALICVCTRLMGKLGVLAKILIFGGIAAFLVVKFDEVVGGFAYIFNFVIESVNDYYGSGIYYILLTDGMISDASQMVFIMFACTLSGWLYMSALLNRKGTIFVVLLSIVSYMVPASLNEAPPLIFMLGMIVFVVCVIIHGVLPREKDDLRARMSGILAMLWVVSLALMIVFAVTRLVPERDFTAPEFYDKIAGRFIFSLRDLQDIADEYNGKKIDISPVTGTGIIGRLDAIEYNDVPVMSVRAPKNGGAIYLKTFQAAEYTKRRWKELDASVYRRYSDLFDELQSGGNTPILMEYRAVAQLADMGAVGVASAEYDIDLTQYVSNGSSYIPTSAVQIDEVFVDELADDDKNITLDTDKAGQYNVSHTYRLYEWRNFSALDKLIIDGEVLANDADNAYQSFVYDNYLDIDDACDDRIKNELFSSIKSGDYSVDTSQGRARFIMDTIAFFAREYEYTLSPGVTPVTEDYVEYFLFEQKSGLCAHFASAAAMIFRSAGIPTRYVEGFVVPQSLYIEPPVANREVSVRKDGEVRSEWWDYYDIELTDRYAHAWVEVYIDGIGWVTVDPTPGYAQNYSESQEWYGGDYTDDEEMEPETVFESESTDETDVMDDINVDESTAMTKDESSAADETTSSAEVLVPGGDGASGGGNTTDDSSERMNIKDIAAKVFEAIKPVLRIMLTVLKIIAVPLVIVLFLVIRQKYMERRRAALYNKNCGLDTYERIESIMSYFESLIKHSGIKVDTSMDFSQLIKNMEVDGVDLSAVSRVVESALFSENQPNEDNTMLVMAYVEAVRGKIYNSKNIFGKLYFKYILAL